MIDSGKGRRRAALAVSCLLFLAAAGVTGFDVGEHYTVGNLPWYHKVWMTVIDRPGVLVAAALLSALFVGFGIFLFMRYWIRSRS